MFIKQIFAIIVLIAMAALAVDAANYARFSDVIVKSTMSIGSNTVPNSKAVLDLTSTTKGFLPPRATNTDINNISSPPAGLILHNTTSTQPMYYNGTGWLNIASVTGTETLTNKTLTSPSITTPHITTPTLAEVATPSNPSASNYKIYPKSDGKLYILNSAGSEAEVGGGGGMTGFFGDGNDGDVTVTTNNLTSGDWISSGALQRDVYFNDLTISGSGSIVTNGYKIFVNGILDLSNAGAGAIKWNGGDGTAGAASVTAGTGATQLALGTILGNASATNGGNGGTANGNQAAAPSDLNYCFNTTTGASGGKGGLGSGSNVGGAARAGATCTNSNVGGLRPGRYDIYFHQVFSSGTIAGIVSTARCAGGSGGAGDGTGGGGGGGAAGQGGIIAIFANTISRGGSTTASAIQAKGGTGGAGGTAAAGARGGGGGGCGGGGGTIYIAYKSLSGSTATDMLDASGGTGGAGGNGTSGGEASGGDGGQGGVGGVIFALDMSTGTSTYVKGTSGTAATPASSTSGTAGGAGNSVLSNL